MKTSTYYINLSIRLASLPSKNAQRKSNKYHRLAGWARRAELTA